MKHPNDRYQTVRDIHNHLKELAAGSGTSERSQSTMVPGTIFRILLRISLAEVRSLLRYAGYYRLLVYLQFVEQEGPVKHA